MRAAASGSTAASSRCISPPLPSPPGHRYPLEPRYFPSGKIPQFLATGRENRASCRDEQRLATAVAIYPHGGAASSHEFARRIGDGRIRMFDQVMSHRRAGFRDRAWRCRYPYHVNERRTGRSRCRAKLSRQANGDPISGARRPISQPPQRAAPSTSAHEQPIENRSATGAPRWAGP